MSDDEAAGGLEAVIQTARHAWRAGLSRALPALRMVNQPRGFDCQACAWPESPNPGAIEFCENGAKAVAHEVTKLTIGREFFAAWPAARLREQPQRWLEAQGRLAEPLWLRPGSDCFEPISWSAAFERAGEALRALDSPDEAIFYTSGRTSNEAAFLYQLFVREYGTNNLPDCSNLCHESSGVALGESLGIGKGSVKLEDFYQTELIIILGQNPGTNHPRMLKALQNAKENGAMIISINPLPETGLMGFNDPQKIKGILGIDSALTDIFLQVKINGDMALLQAIEILLFKEEELD